MLGNQVGNNTGPQASSSRNSLPPPNIGQAPASSSSSSLPQNPAPAPSPFNCKFPDCSNNHNKGFTLARGLTEHTKLHRLVITSVGFASHAEYHDYMDSLVKLLQESGHFMCMKCSEICTQKYVCHCKIHPVNNVIIDEDHPYHSQEAVLSVSYNFLRDNGLLTREVLGQYVAPAVGPVPEGHEAAGVVTFTAILPDATPEEISAVFMTISKANIPTVKSIPKANKAAYTRVNTHFLNLIGNAPEDNNLRAIEYALPKLILQRLPRVGNQKRQTKRKNQEKSISNRCQIMLSDNIAAKRELWHDTFGRAANPQAQPQQSQKDSNEKRSNILISEGQLGRAIQALVSVGIASNTPATIVALREKHPEQIPPIPIILENPIAPPANFTYAQVEKKLKSFPKGSGAGPDGFRPDYFKDMLTASNADGIKFYINAYTKVANLTCEGKTPEGFQPFFAGARLIAIQKPDNGIRPVSVINAHSRMVSKLSSAHVIDDVKAYLAPSQVGVGIQGGASAAVHAINRIMEEEKLRPGMSVLTIDFANAFNQFKRDSLFQEIATHAPALMPLANTKYTIAPHLFLGEALLSSQSGVQQGDPLGPMFFSLLIQRMILKIKEECPLLKANVWYLDDGTIIGPTADVLKAYEIIVEESDSMGLKLNSDKCELWWPNGLAVNGNADQWSQFPLEIKRNVGPGIKLLGIPVGHGHAPEVVNHRIDKIASLLDVIIDSGLTVHSKLLLLRSCAAMPKFMFALQSTPPEHIQACIARFDTLVTDSLSTIIGDTISPVTRSRMALPISMGGLGIPTAADTALPAYLGSLIQTLNLQAKIIGIPTDDLLPPIELLLTAFNVTMAPDNQLLLAPLRASKQPQLLISRAVNNKNSKLLGQRMRFEGTPVQQRAYLASEAPYSGEWLKAYPISGLNLVMPNRNYILVLRAYFGLNLYKSLSRCIICNDAPNDQVGIHASNCSKGGNLHRRHDTMKFVFAALCREAGYSTETEPNNILEDGSLDRPADVLVRQFQGGKDVAIDVNITSTTNGQDHPSIILDRVAQRKIQKYRTRCEAVNLDFEPLVMDAVGGFHKDAIPILKRLGNVWSTHKNCSPATGRSRVIQQICFQVKRVMGEEYAKRDPGRDLIEVVSLEETVA